MIRVLELSKRYGPVRALDGVSLEVARGEVVGFLGPNGAGKSTTMKILTGYLQPDAGTAEIDGQPVDRGIEARRRVGYLPESTPLYRSMRVDRYLEWVGRARGMGRRARREALERVVASCDLDGYVRRAIGTLSKGYRQRVGLAQALLSDPPVLILDEPTSGLDPVEIVRIRDLVRRLGEEKTVLLSSHVLGEVQEICPRVVILAGGRVVADGAPDELARAQGAGLTVAIRGPEDDVRTALAGLDGVSAVKSVGTRSHGARAYRVEASERTRVAELVAALAADRGWPLSELRHDETSLEDVFLERTSASAVAAGPFADPEAPA